MKLTKLENGNYRIVAETHSFEGEWGKVYFHLLHELEVPKDEIEFALECMRAKNHDTANFGIHHLFTHTSQSLDVIQVLAELRVASELRKEFHKEFELNKDSIETRKAYAALMQFYQRMDLELMMGVVADKTELKVA